MFDKLGEVEKRFDELNRLMSDPEVIARQTDYQKYAREQSELSPIIAEFKLLRSAQEQLADNEVLLETEKDPEMLALVEEETKSLKEDKAKAEENLKLLLLPKDPRDEKGVILEIRAGTGGEEASLFAADLFRMYTRYAELQKWKVELLSESVTGKGGLKEVIANIQGRNVFSKLKYESGTHRVQRVPETETQGRIHTSAVTVAILPEVEAVELDIHPNDLKFDVFRSSGPGGQSVNTTDSAVRITHIPSGLVVSCQDEKSQHKNKEKGLRVLRARVYDEMQRKQHDELAKERKEQVGSGDRSGRIRTYNFPQERITDHRIGLTLHKLSQVLEGDMAEFIEKLSVHFQTEDLKKAAS